MFLQNVFVSYYILLGTLEHEYFPRITIGGYTFLFLGELVGTLFQKSTFARGYRRNSNKNISKSFPQDLICKSTSKILANSTSKAMML